MKIIVSLVVLAFGWWQGYLAATALLYTSGDTWRTWWRREWRALRDDPPANLTPLGRWFRKRMGR
jgi:hypothetical protein